MAMQMEDLRKRLDGEGLKYFIDPARPALMMGFTGLTGRYQCVVLLEQDGKFMQFRSLQYQHCPADHAHTHEVLKVLGALNYRIRFVKFGWDPKDGEIVAYADVCLGDDGTLTQAQFHHIAYLYMTVVDVSALRFRQTLETGKDPGEMEPAALAAKMLGQKGGGLPEKLHALLEKIKDKPSGGSGDTPEPGVDVL